MKHQQATKSAQKEQPKPPSSLANQTSLDRITTHPLLKLQRTIGNQAVQRMMHSGRLGLQARGHESGMQAPPSPAAPVVQHTGLPDSLKAGVETLSGISMDDVHVHYNSSKPAQVQALAYTQGTEIHVGSGQEQHLAHEAWHVVQQKQGRVKPTLQAKGVAINDDQGLEREADVMGEKALKGNSGKGSIDYSSVECEKFNLKSLTRPLETGVVSLSIAQLTKMYNHNSKEYFNDEDSEPAPNGYTRVVANPGTTPGWTQTPPLAGSVSLKYLVQIASARKTNDHDRGTAINTFHQRGIWR